MTGTGTTSSDSDKKIPRVELVTWNRRSTKCNFCKQWDGNEEKYGPMYKYGTLTMHYFCMAFSSGISQVLPFSEGIFGFDQTDVRRELKNVMNVICIYCGSGGANVKCGDSSCPQSFHFSCSWKKKLLVRLTGQFSALCDAHSESYAEKDGVEKQWSQGPFDYSKMFKSYSEDQRRLGSIVSDNPMDLEKEKFLKLVNLEPSPAIVLQKLPDSVPALVAGARQVESGSSDKLPGLVAGARQVESGSSDKLPALVPAAKQVELGSSDKLPTLVPADRQVEPGSSDKLPTLVPGARQVEPGSSDKLPTLVPGARQVEPGSSDKLPTLVPGARQVEPGSSDKLPTLVPVARQVEPGSPAKLSAFAPGGRAESSCPIFEVSVPSNSFVLKFMRPENAEECIPPASLLDITNPKIEPSSFEVYELSSSSSEYSASESAQLSPQLCASPELTPDLVEAPVSSVVGLISCYDSHVETLQPLRAHNESNSDNENSLMPSYFANIEPLDSLDAYGDFDVNNGCEEALVPADTGYEDVKQEAEWQDSSSHDKSSIFGLSSCFDRSDRSDSDQFYPTVISVNLASDPNSILSPFLSGSSVFQGRSRSPSGSDLQAESHDYAEVRRIAAIEPSAKESGTLPDFQEQQIRNKNPGDKDDSFDTMELMDTSIERETRATNQESLQILDSSDTTTALPLQYDNSDAYPVSCISSSSLNPNRMQADSSVSQKQQMCDERELVLAEIEPQVSADDAIVMAPNVVEPGSRGSHTPIELEVPYATPVPLQLSDSTDISTPLPDLQCDNSDSSDVCCISISSSGLTPSHIAETTVSHMEQTCDEETVVLAEPESLTVDTAIAPNVMEPGSLGSDTPIELEVPYATPVPLQISDSTDISTPLPHLQCDNSDSSDVCCISISSSGLTPNHIAETTVSHMEQTCDEGAVQLAEPVSLTVDTAITRNVVEPGSLSLGPDLPENVVGVGVNENHFIISKLIEPEAPAASPVSLQTSDSTDTKQPHSPCEYTKTSCYCCIASRVFLSGKEATPPGLINSPPTSLPEREGKRFPVYFNWSLISSKAVTQPPTGLPNIVPVETTSAMCVSGFRSLKRNKEENESTHAVKKVRLYKRKRSNNKRMRSEDKSADSQISANEAIGVSNTMMPAVQ